MDNIFGTQVTGYRGYAVLTNMEFMLHQLQ